MIDAMSGWSRLLLYVLVIGLSIPLILWVKYQPPELAGILVMLVSSAFTIVLIVWLISVGVRSGMKGVRRDAMREAPRGYPGARVLDMPQDFVPPPAGGFPVVTDGPGRYVVRGVDRESKMDTTWHCTADSPENAKVKGELQGIIVTAVEYVGRS